MVITPEYKVLIDPPTAPSDGFQYIGLAMPNVQTDDPSWIVMRLTFSSDDLAALEWANGTNQLVNVWDDRLSDPYS